MKKLAILAVPTALLVTLSCAQLVGITDTEVTSGGTDASGVGGGAGSLTTAGQTGQGGKNGGTAGSNASGGTPAGGTSEGGTHAGGMSDGGAPTGGTPGGGGSTGGTPIGGSPASGGGGGGGSAPVLHGPKLVNIGTYSVDATEVTVGHYKEFLQAKGGNTSGQPPACSWNLSYYEADGSPVPLDADTWPIANVDWCDAVAYCSWAGKRLCGAIGGGAVANADAFDPTKSQWFRACGGGQGATHPNNTPECNNQGGFEDVAAVATFPGCEGFYPGLFDLQGNVWEWIDSCDGSTGKTNHCLNVGSSELQQIGYCTAVDDEETRDFTSPYAGFRCCSK